MTKVERLSCLRPSTECLFCLSHALLTKPEKSLWRTVITRSGWCGQRLSSKSKLVRWWEGVKHWRITQEEEKTKGILSQVSKAFKNKRIMDNVKDKNPDVADAIDSVSNLAVDVGKQTIQNRISDRRKLHSKRRELRDIKKENTKNFRQDQKEKERAEKRRARQKKK